MIWFYFIFSIAYGMDVSANTLNGIWVLREYHGTPVFIQFIDFDEKIAGIREHSVEVSLHNQYVEIGNYTYAYEIEGVKKGDLALFDLANNLTNEGGVKVDIYIYDVEPDEIQGSRSDVNGRTDAKFETENISFKDGSSYWTITSDRHPNNVTIEMGSDSKTKHVAHEFGHAIYQTRNTSDYRSWLLRNPKQQNKGGHGKGDPSGKAAEAAEKNFKE